MSLHRAINNAWGQGSTPITNCRRPFNWVPLFFLCSSFFLQFRTQLDTSSSMSTTKKPPTEKKIFGRLLPKKVCSGKRRKGLAKTNHKPPREGRLHSEASRRDKTGVVKLNERLKGDGTRCKGSILLPLLSSWLLISCFFVGDGCGGWCCGENLYVDILHYEFFPGRICNS